MVKGLHIEAADYVRETYLQTQGEIEYHHLAGSLYRQFGERKSAIDIYQNCLLIYPEDDISKIALSTLGIGAIPNRIPDTILQHIFDKNAHLYEENMLSLDYTSHEKVSEAVLSFKSTSDGEMIILDMGCGTGLLGQILKPHNVIIQGVDISKKMLEIARSKNIYDMLFCEEILSFIENTIVSYDIVAASNTVMYFGNLVDLLKPLTTILKKGGLFVFDYELFVGDGFDLHTGGRYSHSPEYVKKSLLNNGFFIKSSNEFIMREQAGKPVSANLLVAERT